MALSNQNETFATLNPYTPMAFLPPKLAYEAQAMAFIQVGALGVRQTCIFIFISTHIFSLRCLYGIS